MNVLKSIQNRHSIQQYTDQKTNENTQKELLHFINHRNKESELNIQLRIND